MLKDDLVKQLMATYVEELDDQVRALNRDLLELEKAQPGKPREELIKTLLRSAHTLKGASRSVNVSLIESACHLLEDIFAALQKGELSLGAELFAALFAAADAIEDAGKRVRRDEDLADGALASVLPKLRSLAAGRTRQPAADAARQTTEPRTPAEDTRVKPSSAEATEAVLPSAPANAMPVPDEPIAATVRVAADKLDALLGQSCEFLVALRRLQGRIEDLETLSASIAQCHAECSAEARSLRMAPHLLGNPWSNAQRPALPPISQRLPTLFDRTTDRLERLKNESGRLLSNLAADTHHLERAACAVDEEVRRIRLLPFSDACLGLDRMARDLAQAAGKVIAVAVDANGVEVDRSVVESLKDSLRHLVRNAVDHGIETPDERRASAKPPCGRITIAAALHGSQVEVDVADDGRGLDLPALRESLRKNRIAEPAGDQELARMIFLPGISTAKTVTDISGRGMGLDIVKSRAEAAHGAVDVSFEAGRGTCVKVAVPLTLTSLQTLLVNVGGQTFGFVCSNVQRTGRLDPATLKRIEGREMLLLEEGLIPVASLADMVGLPRPAPSEKGTLVPYVVVAAGKRRIALLVDEHVAEQEITIKSLGARIECVPHISGATILPSGRIAMILNAASLIRSAIELSPGPLARARAAAPRKRLLFAEDSVTTRTLISSILSDAGYDVTATPDGAAAWELLQDAGADLIVTDITMPRMDGFALTEAVRKSSRFRELPVVLLTTHETNEDKARGAAAGANAYLVKSAFDQRNLLETIAQLL